VIDLHLHTTASDGLESPTEVLEACRTVGFTAVAITDHDTMSGVAEAARAAAAVGVTLVPGIEFSSAWQGKDVHILGYFLDHGSAELETFLSVQRTERVARARLIGERLVEAGAPVDMEALIRASKGRPVLRPAIARALVAAGHAPDEPAAFERFLGREQPAYVPHVGPLPVDVIDLIRRLGGKSSMAHPGVTRLDQIIDTLTDAGLDALEAYHPDHDAGAAERYVGMARARGLSVTGGSDYHGARSHHGHGFATTTLPAAAFEEFCRR
jgi:3',5'-nucleoside bisphosphate phosphatase